MEHVEAEMLETERLRIRILPDGRLSRKDAAAYLGLSAKTLATWAMTGRGPQGRKVGGRVFYRRDELDQFISGDAAA